MAFVCNAVVIVPQSILLYFYVIPTTTTTDRVAWLTATIAFRTYMVGFAEFAALAMKGILYSLVAQYHEPLIVLVVIHAIGRKKKSSSPTNAASGGDGKKAE